MKVIAPPAQAAIESGAVVVAGAAELLTDPPTRVWSGDGPITIDGASYIGVGNRAIGQATNAAVGSAAQSLTLSLSGIDPEAIALLGAAELRGAAVTVRRLIFDGTGTRYLDGHVFSRGRVDTVSTEETIGGEAAVNVAVEGAARGLGRRGGRMRTDADQRLVGATDGGFKRVSYAGQKTLYWGGQRPATASSALTG